MMARLRQWFRAWQIRDPYQDKAEYLRRLEINALLSAWGDK